MVSILYRLKAVKAHKNLSQSILTSEQPSATQISISLQTSRNTNSIKTSVVIKLISMICGADICSIHMELPHIHFLFPKGPRNVPCVFNSERQANIYVIQSHSHFPIFYKLICVSIKVRKWDISPHIPKPGLFHYMIGIFIFMVNYNFTYFNVTNYKGT